MTDEIRGDAMTQKCGCLKCQIYVTAFGQSPISPERIGEASFAIARVMGEVLSTFDLQSQAVLMNRLLDSRDEAALRKQDEAAKPPHADLAATPVAGHG